MNPENKLPEDFKKKWVAALRSGEYKQGKSYLFNGDGYCCMGVAAALCGVEERYMRGRTYVGTGYESHAMPPVGFPKILIADGADVANNQVKTLARMNDNDGKSFSEIADYIEANL